jgi:hypothetical protein
VVMSGSLMSERLMKAEGDTFLTEMKQAQKFVRVSG